MSLPSRTFYPAGRWPHTPSWMVRGDKVYAFKKAYNRFQGGESPMTIAGFGTASGNPIQIQTVTDYAALECGYAVDLHRLARYSRPPSEAEWQRLEDCSRISGIDMTKPPPTEDRQ